MGSQTSTSRHQALSDAHQSGIPGLIDPSKPAILDSRAPGHGLPPDGQGSAAGGLPPLSMSPLDLLQPTPPTPSRTPKDSASVIDVNETIPCVITWSHGGHNVYVTGSFNNWSVDQKIKLVRSGHEFTVILELARGVHHYKFIVDEQWKYAPDQATQSDEHGNINNMLDISSYQHYPFRLTSDQEHAQLANYHQHIPDASEYSTDAPTIPILLSKSTCVAVEPPNAKPSSIPLHCTTNHVYHDGNAPNAFGPNISCIATSQRWRSSAGQNYCGQRYGTFLFVTVNPLHPQPPDSQSSYAIHNPLKHILKINPKTHPHGGQGGKGGDHHHQHSGGKHGGENGKQGGGAGGSASPDNNGGSTPVASAHVLGMLAWFGGAALRQVAEAGDARCPRRNKRGQQQQQQQQKGNSTTNTTSSNKRQRGRAGSRTSGAAAAMARPRPQVEYVCEDDGDDDGEWTDIPDIMTDMVPEKGWLGTSLPRADTMSPLMPPVMELPPPMHLLPSPPTHPHPHTIHHSPRVDRNLHIQPDIISLEHSFLGLVAA